MVGHLRGVKLAYAVSKNIAMLKPEIESIEKALHSIEDYNEFQKERVELAQKYSKKDEKGEAVKEIKDNQEVFVLEDKKSFEKELKELQEKHNAGIEEYTNFLEDETHHVFHKIKVSELPQDISPAELNSIFAIVAE